MISDDNCAQPQHLRRTLRHRKSQVLHPWQLRHSQLLASRSCQIVASRQWLQVSWLFPVMLALTCKTFQGPESAVVSSDIL
jgi:hypothetical protein